MSHQPFIPSSARAMAGEFEVLQTEERGEHIHHTFHDGYSDNYGYHPYSGTTMNGWPYDQAENHEAMIDTSNNPNGATHYPSSQQGWQNVHTMIPAPSPHVGVDSYGSDLNNYIQEPVTYLPLENRDFEGLDRQHKQFSNPPPSTSDEDNFLEDPGDVEASQQSPYSDANPVPNLGLNQAGTGRSRASSTLADLDVLECTVEGCRSQFRGEYRKSNLARHSRLRHASGGRLYPCEGGCDKVFKRQDARLKHYRRKHPNMPTLPPVPRPRNGTPTV